MDCNSNPSRLVKHVEVYFCPLLEGQIFVTDETVMDLKYGWCFFHQWVVSFSTSIALDDYHFFVTAPAEGVLLIFRAISHLPLEIICFATTVMN